MDERYATGPGDMKRLGHLGDLEVADDSPDVRGWDVNTADDRTIGVVDDLIVDTRAMKARYMLVDLADEFRSADVARDERQVLVPVARARVDEADHVVRLDVPSTSAVALPRFGGAVPTGYDESYERTAPRAPGREPETPGRDEQRITRSAEELKIGRRKVPAGEVKVSKHVETEHVREPVERMREDVRVERRPASGATGRAELREDEIRVPITEEEVVVEKRPTVKEELVISKEAHTEKVDVDADVRKERIDVDRTDGKTRSTEPKRTR